MQSGQKRRGYKSNNRSSSNMFTNALFGQHTSDAATASVPDVDGVQTGAGDQYAPLRKKMGEVAEQKKAAEQISLVDKHELHDFDVFAKFLEYDCNYKKFKGSKWGEVLEVDPDYLVWVLTEAMNVRTKTWSVLSMVLTPEQRARAFKRSQETKQFKPVPSKKKKRKTVENGEEGEGTSIQEEEADALPTPPQLTRS